LARNVEIKARVAGIEALMPRVRALADGDVQRLTQDDTFFRVPHGRLKLRELGEFIELEVVLRDDQSESDGVRIAEHLMHRLGLAAAPRIAGAYLDLLATA
jgi:adenylate cyclase class IV